MIGFYTGQGTTAASGALADIACGAITATAFSLPATGNMVVGAAGNERLIEFYNSAGNVFLGKYSNAGITVYRTNGNPGTIRASDGIFDSTGYVYWNTRGALTSSANGVVHVQNYDFNDSINQTLAFGAATTSTNGSRIKRVVGASLLAFRNGNDSADAPISCGAITASDYIYGTSAQFSALGAFGGYGVGSATLAVQALNSATVGINIRGQSGQTSDLLKCKTSANTDVFTVGPTGAITASGIIATSTYMTAPAGYYSIGSGGNALGYDFDVSTSTKKHVLTGQIGAAFLCLGGTTSSFPAIKRNAAAINLRLADDSADAALTCGAITASGNVTGPVFVYPNTTTPAYPASGMVAFCPGSSDWNLRSPYGQAYIQIGGGSATNVSSYGTMMIGGTGGVRLQSNPQASGPSVFLKVPSTSALNLRNTADSADIDLTCGAITASGSIQETPTQSASDPTTSDIPAGKRMGWYNTTTGEFRDWVNIGGTLKKSAAYT